MKTILTTACRNGNCWAPPEGSFYADLMFLFNWFVGVKKAREKTVLRMNQFTKGIKFFQENLGFTFKKVDGTV